LPSYAIEADAVDFSTMILSMWVEAIDQSLLAGRLGFNPWHTEHHFRGPWHSAPLEFAAYTAPQLPEERYLGYHGSGQAARDSLTVMDRVWDHETGDEPYGFHTPAWRGRIVKRISPSPYRRRRPMLIRTARTAEATLEAARRGSPAFLGTFGTELETQVPLYRSAVADAGHPPEVVEECLRWSTVDWLSVVVAERDDDAPELVALARAEQSELGGRFLAQTGQPALGPGDTIPAIAGGPETIARSASCTRRASTTCSCGSWASGTHPRAGSRSSPCGCSPSGVLPEFAGTP
jgi:hypothetical protein